MTQHPPTLDAAAAANWLARPHPSSPWLHEEVGQRMAQRLAWIVQAPGSWLSWQPDLGGRQAEAEVSAAYPDAAHWRQNGMQAQPVRVQQTTAQPWWHPKSWRGAAVLPNAFEQVGMVWANMALHAHPQPQALLAHWYRCLAQDGFVMFSCLGPDTLKELREVYARQGWPAPAHAFTDMHDWGDMLVQAGFAEPVMDMERIVLTFATPQRVLQELRELGRNTHVNRFSGLRGRRWHAQLLQALQGLADPLQDGQLSLTFEIVYGHAYKPPPRAKVAATTEISLQDMRVQLKNAPR